MFNIDLGKGTLYVLIALTAFAGVFMINRGIVNWDTRIRLDERRAVEREQAALAQSRIRELETNNAKHRAMSEYDRCIALMQHSGLQQDSCGPAP